MAEPRPELHRPFPVERVGRQGVDERVEATPAECLALARRMAVPAVLALACRFRLIAEPAGAVLAEGRLEARVVQDCVVTLDAFESVVAESFRVRFVPALDGVEMSESDAALDPLADDEIAYAGASIDLGEAAAEQLGLALDPYPRKPGAELPEDGGAGDASPFAGLARLRRPPG